MSFDIASLVAKYQLKGDEVSLLETLRIDASQQEKIANYEQRTDEWFKSRENRLTGSNLGSARGHCAYTSKSELLKRMLWGGFQGNAATEYGTKNESVAVDLYTQFMRKQTSDKFGVKHQGLWVPLQHPWIGISVDALVYDDSEPEVARKKGGAEIKCPYGKKLYPFIPSMYFDQIQGSMGFLQLPWWDFVVWTPGQTQIRRFDFDPLYFSQELFPRLEQFYFTDFLPRAVMRDKGLLKPGKIDPVIEIPMDLEDMTEQTKISPSTTEPEAAAAEIASVSHLPKCGDTKGHFSIGALLR